MHMYRVSDESGAMKTTLVSEGKLSKTFLESKDGEHTNSYQCTLASS